MREFITPLIDLISNYLFFLKKKARENLTTKLIYKIEFLITA